MSYSLGIFSEDTVNTENANWEQTNKGFKYNPQDLSDEDAASLAQAIKVYLSPVERSMGASLLTDIDTTKRTGAELLVNQLTANAGENFLTMIQNQNFSGMDLSQNIVFDIENPKSENPQEQFVGAYIKDVNLSSKAGKKTKLDSMNLSGTVLQNVSARGASFQNTNLHQTTFDNCDLRGVDFSQAQIKETNFVNCILDKSIWENADLENVKLVNCTFRDTDINEVKIKNLEINQSILDNVNFLVDKNKSGIEIDGLGIYGSIFANSKISPEVNLHAAESWGSALILDDAENIFDKETYISPASYFENTPVNVAIKHILTDSEIAFTAEVLKEFSGVNYDLQANIMDELKQFPVGVQPRITPLLKNQKVIGS